MRTSHHDSPERMKFPQNKNNIIKVALGIAKIDLSIILKMASVCYNTQWPNSIFRSDNSLIKV